MWRLGREDAGKNASQVSNGATGQMFMSLTKEYNSGESIFQGTKTCKLIISLGINLVILRRLWETHVEIFTRHKSTAVLSGFTTSFKRQCCGPG